MANRYFVEGPLFPGEFPLDGPEAHHLLNVMRCEVGERIVLFCGDGTEAAAEIVGTSNRAVLLNVEPPVSIDRELAGPIHIATAFPKGDRADFLVEKLTELGVAELTPLNTERTVNRLRADKLDKFRRQVVEASKQCGRNRLMVVNPPVDLLPFLGKERDGGRWIPHPIIEVLATTCFGIAPHTFCIGPEGGFSAGEIAAATASGWTAFSLGTRILRTETACIAAAAEFARLR